MADKYRPEVLKFKGLTDEGSAFYVFDLETTGLSASVDEITEFAADKYQKREGEYVKVDSLTILINPEIPIPEVVAEKTGITNELVRAEGLKQKDAVEKIKAFLGDNPIIMGYNSLSFDNAFMNSLYRRFLGEDFSPAFHLDVIKMAREKKSGSHTLGVMAEQAGFTGDGFHRAGFDIAATMAVFKWLLPEYEFPEPRDDDDFTVKNIRRWKKSETLDRLYVGNSKNYSIYYDIPLQEWVVNANLDDAVVIAKVYEFAGVSDVEELMKLY